MVGASHIQLRPTVKVDVAISKKVFKNGLMIFVLSYKDREVNMIRADAKTGKYSDIWIHSRFSPIPGTRQGKLYDYLIFGIAANRHNIESLFTKKPKFNIQEIHDEKFKRRCIVRR